MAQWSYSALVGLWEAVGGSRYTAFYAADVALAESGGDDRLVSSTGDYGLWQINAAAHPHYSTASLLTPRTNARAAIAISHNGGSWTQWCTAWTDGACGKKGGHYAPLGDSPAGREYARHPVGAPGAKQTPASQAGAPPGVQGPTGTPEPLTMFNAWHHLTWELAVGIPTQMRRARADLRSFALAVRVGRIGGGPPGLQGPTG